MARQGWMRGVVVLLALQAAFGTAAEQKPLWQVGGGEGVQTESDGVSPVDPRGTMVTLRSTRGGKANSSTRLPAQAFLGRRLQLQAELSTTQADGGAGLWLRADDADGKSVAFVNSLDAPLRPSARQQRAIEIDVPPSARTIRVGLLLLDGGGEVSARGLRLQSRVIDAHETATAILDVAIPAIRDMALNADRIDWARVEPDLRQRADGMLPGQAYEAIRVLLRQLDDAHSQVLSPSGRHARNMVAATAPPPVVRMDEEGTGWIQLPGLIDEDPQRRLAFVRTLREGIAATAPGVRCGWILDLRGNTGGSMWPMLAGLRALLGDADLGFFDSRDGRSAPWRADGRKPLGEEDVPDLQAAAVAVLYGPHTTSAGEAVAIAFRGRTRSRSFGQPTAGLSTGNRSVPLPDGGLLLVAASREVDRLGTVYDGRLPPDMVTVTPREDARAWLLAQGCGGSGSSAAATP